MHDLGSWLSHNDDFWAAKSPKLWVNSIPKCNSSLPPLWFFFTKNLSLFKDGFPNLCRARWCFFLHLSPQAPLWVSTHHLPCFPNLSFSLLRAKMTRNKNTWIHISMIYWSSYKDADTHFAKHVYGNISFSPVIYTGGKSCLLWVNNPTLSSVLCRIFCQNNANQFFNSRLQEFWNAHHVPI